MALLGIAVASDIASALLKHYTRGPALSQTMQDRPLLAMLNAGKKTFPGGNQYLSDPVQGAYMSDTAGFFIGYTEDDQLPFKQASNLLRAEVLWYEVAAGIVITWTELKKDGITIGDHSKKTEHAGIAIDRLTSLLENRMDDFRESWARSMNTMLWGDGTQDAKQVPGVRALITETPAVGVTAGLNRATYAWWQNNAFLGLGTSEANQTLTKTIRSKQRVIRKRGGKPSKFLAGSLFLEALDAEYQAKGSYTITGFSKTNDIDQSEISLRGVGSFSYDPTLDDMGLSKYCYEFDTRRLRLRPMEGEDNKLLTPERPYDYAIFLQTMTWTGALQVTQLNAQAIFSIA